MIQHIEYDIRVPIFNVKVLLVVSNNAEEFCKDASLELIAKHERAVVYDVTELDTVPYSWIALFRFDYCHENTINHECFHLTAQILRYFDTPLVNETEEVYAYLNEYFYKIIRQKTIEAKEVLNGNSDT